MAMTDKILERLKGDRAERTYIEIPGQPPRTLVLIGRTRSGKSTIAKVLQDSLYVPPTLEIFCGTRRPTSEKVNGLTIIDMPGFYNQERDDSDYRLSNQTIESMLNDEIKSVGLSRLIFAFVLNVANGINNEDILTMILVKNQYPEIGPQTMLILSHCEEESVTNGTKLANDFFNALHASKLERKALFGRGLYFMGSIRCESELHQDLPAMLREHRNVQEMRNALITSIFSDINHDSTFPLISGSEESARGEKRCCFGRCYACFICCHRWPCIISLCLVLVMIGLCVSRHEGFY